METRKRVWIAALCLLSAAVLTIGLRLHVARVQAATLPAQAAQLRSSGPDAHFANASLRAAAVRNAVLLDDDAGATRVTANQQKDRALSPPVEQFTLTPPNPAQNLNQTMLAVRFGAGVEKLPSRIAMTLGTQHVIVQRSGEAPDTYVTLINFDWQAFAKEQEQRKQAAANGKMVPVFQGRRFLRTEPMQFVDPLQIQGALQSKQPLQLSPEMLMDGPSNLPNDHVLMITNLNVVSDPQRTFDPCLPATSPQNMAGAWTFNTLMQAIACSTASQNCNQQAAEDMLLSMLSQWQSTQTVNTFQVPARNIGVLGQSGLLANWPIDTANSCNLNGAPSACPSLPKAPVHLLAIVNRIDLGQSFPPFTSPNPPGGELRFVFNVTADTTPGHGACSAADHGSNLFTIILEYNVPARFSTAQQWADQWNMLQDPTNNFGATYRSDLQSIITDQVVTAGACTNSAGQAVSCLAQIRTNEIEIQNNGLWEQRQFQLPTITLANNAPVLKMAPVSMTPDSSFDFQPQSQLHCGSAPAGIHACNNGLFLKSWIDDNTSEILQTDGALPIVPNIITNNSGQTAPFLGGSAFNDATAFWVDQQPANNEQARSDFSLNTCNACHGGETATNFLQVDPRASGTGMDSPANLSNFLLGCAPPLPNTCGSMAGQLNGRTCAVAQCTINMPGSVLVNDPNDPQMQNTFGDILRRQMYFGGLLSDGPGSGGMLLPFLAQPIGPH